MVNHLMYLNPNVTLHEVQSYINFINDHYTDNKPMIRKEMLRTVAAEYERIKETGQLNVKLRIKKVHTNPTLHKEQKQLIANQQNGKIRKDQSFEIIKVAIEALSAKGLEISPSQIFKTTEGKISLATIKRYYKLVVEQMRKQNEKVTVAGAVIKEVHKLRKSSLSALLPL